MTPLEQCARLLVRAAEKLRGELSPRELVALQIGLRASHMEEALMQGDAARALAHFKGIMRLIAELHATRSGPADPLARR